MDTMSVPSITENRLNLDNITEEHHRTHQRLILIMRSFHHQDNTGKSIQIDQKQERNIQGKATIIHYQEIIIPTKLAKD